jgi:glycosyltransferase involved in cell wall biosynthesis
VGGTEKMKQYWMKKIKERDLNQNNIIFTGFIIQKLIPLYLKIADILFIPFDFNIDSNFVDLNTTSPMKLFEYMAAKRPIVSSSISTIQKVISHNKEALLAASDDPEEYANLIKNLLNNPNLAKRIAKNAYQKVQNYTYKSRCKKIINKFT